MGSLNNLIHQKAWESANGEPFTSKQDAARLSKDGYKGLIEAITKELELVVTELEAGRNPYLANGGTTIVAYRSPLDGRLLGSRMKIPKGLDPQKRYKLTIWNTSSSRMSGGAMRPRWVRGGGHGVPGECDRRGDL